jgi:hypothetical protein
LNLKKFTLLISVFFISYFSIAQTIESSLLRADSLYKTDKKEAYQLYNRIYFFGDTSTSIIALRNLINLSQELKLNDDGIIYTKKLLQYNLDDTLRNNTYVKQLQFHYQSGNYQYLCNSIEISDSMENTMLSDTLTLKSELLYKGLACLHLDQKTQALAYIKKLITLEKDSIKHAALTEIFNEYSVLKFYNPKKAKNRSLVFPGLGQLYAKDYRNAANSAILNSTLIAGFVYTAHYYSILNAALFWQSIISHYYIGSARTAESISMNKNNTSKKIIADKFLLAFQ